MDELKSVIEKAFDDIANINPDNCGDLTRVIDEVMNLINTGQLRVSEKVNNEWITNQWVKKAVLLSFKTKNNSIIDNNYTKYFGHYSNYYQSFGYLHYFKHANNLRNPQSLFTLKYILDLKKNNIK